MPHCIRNFRKFTQCSLVEALEAHVGEPKEQQQALREGLCLLATALAVPAESVPLSLEEIYSW